MVYGEIIINMMMNSMNLLILLCIMKMI